MEARIQKQIEILRGDISIITEYTKGNNTKKVKRKPKDVLKKSKVHSMEPAD